MKKRLWFCCLIILYNYVENSKFITEPFVGSSMKAEPEDENIDHPVVGTVEGDIILGRQRIGDVLDIVKRKIAPASKLWPHRTLPWTFSGGKRKFKFANSYKKVWKVIRYLEKNTCLKFPLWTKEKQNYLGATYLEFGTGDGCASLVGYYGQGPQFVHLRENGCIKFGIILHEVSHAIGLYHEHSRTDRDDHVKVNFENISPWAVRNFQAKDNSFNLVEYDLSSVMHYGPRAFGIRRSITLESIDHRLQFLLGQRRGYSFYDLKSVQLAYKCPESCKRFIHCINGGFLTEKCRCHCPKGLKGKNCGSVQSAKECGGILSLTTSSPSKIIRFTSESFVRRVLCTWFIQSPSATRMKITIRKLLMERDKTSRSCKQWLEVRYNLIGQQAPRYCGNSAKQRSFNSSSNAILLRMNSKLVETRKSTFEAFVEINTHLDEDIQCTFETNTGWCIFEQSSKDDFDWIMHHGKTPSHDTGPDGGYLGSHRYVYLEASKPRRTGDKAALESRLIKGGKKCITLHYHMYGSGMGRLRFMISTADEQPEEVIRKIEDQGNQWHTIQIFVRSSQPFQLMIEGMVGRSWLSDIALDDVFIKGENCSWANKTVFLGKNVESEISCNFQGSYCGFNWSPKQAVHWVFHSLSKFGINGSLMVYLWVLKKNEIARVWSPLIFYQRPSCLSLMFKTKGTHLGTITLSVVDYIKNTSKVYWSSSGEVNRSHLDKVTENINGNFDLLRVVITVSMRNIRSEPGTFFAIDSLSFKPFPCEHAQGTLPFLCTFEIGMCGFKTVNGTNWKRSNLGLMFGPLTDSNGGGGTFLIHEGAISLGKVIRSPPFQLLGDGCLSFNYYGFGLLMSGLTVKQKMLKKTSILWETKSLIEISIWNEVKLTVYGSELFWLEFSTGDDYMFGNYAIDNVQLQPTRCVN